MEYECKIVPFDKTIVIEGGVIEPLCNDCRTPDCTNPIREQTVSVFGIPKKMRLWTSGQVVRMVAACRGYIGDKVNSLDQTGAR